LKFKFFLRKDVNLTKYVTTEGLAKKKICKMPKEGEKMMSYNELLEYIGTK